jgi:integrase
MRRLCKELNVLRGAFSWARRNGWKGLENVAVHLEDQPDYAVQEYLTRDEARRLIEACIEPHTRLFVRIALATGARMSAILELTWDRVYWPVVGNQEPAPDNKALWAVELPGPGADGRRRARADVGRP